MKAKNYRIGNYIMYKDRVFDLHSLSPELPFLNTEEFGCGVVEWDDIIDIPITSSWLECLGFVYIAPTLLSFNISELDVKLYYNTCNIFSLESEDTIIMLDVNYIHELQNLFFDLTKKELTLKD